MDKYFKDLFQQIADFFKDIDYVASTFDIIRFFIVIGFIFLITRLIYFMLNRISVMTIKNQTPRALQRRKTINKVLSSLLQYSFYVATFLYTLMQFNISATTLITGVGAIGIIVTFAFQDLLKDIVAGFFVIIENTYDVGDSVMFGTVQGVVDNLSLRSTTLIGTNGERHFFRNAMIINVANYTKHEIKSRKLFVTIKREQYQEKLKSLDSLDVFNNATITNEGVIKFDEHTIEVALVIKSSQLSEKTIADFKLLLLAMNGIIKVN